MAQQKFFVDVVLQSGARIGIGGITPTQLLHIQSSTVPIILVKQPVDSGVQSEVRLENGVGGSPRTTVLRSPSTGSEGQVGTTSVHFFHVMAGGLNRISVDPSTGFVGIGTSVTPIARLHIQAGQAVFDNTGGINSGLNISLSGTIEALLMVAAVAGNLITGSLVGDLCIRAQASRKILMGAAGGLTQMVLDTTGRVAIGGGTSPFAALDVSGIGNVVMRMISSTGNTNMDFVQTPSGNVSYISFEGASSKIMLGGGTGGTGGVPATMTVEQGGLSARVGIGTTSPSVRLEVVEVFRVSRSGVPANYIAINMAGGAFQIWASLGGALDLGVNASHLYINDTGKVGISVTPSSTWSGNFRPVEIGRNGNFIAGNALANQIVMGSNTVFITPNYKYVFSEAAALYEQNNGAHSFYVAAAGVSGNTITFINVMTVDVTARVGIGLTAPLYKLHVKVSATSDDGISVEHSGTTNIVAQLVRQGTSDQGQMILYQSGVQKVSMAAAGNSWLESGGNFGMGTSVPAVSLHIQQVGTPAIRITTPTLNPTGRWVTIRHFTTGGAENDMLFQTAAGGGDTTQMRIGADGNVSIGPESVNATGSTQGFLLIRTVSGTPTGVPGGVSTGHVAMQYDTAANKLWVYNAGWKSVTLA